MMQTNQKKLFLLWFFLFVIISILFIIQSSFWPQILYKYHLVPQLALPVVIYIFSKNYFASSVVTIILISMISNSFSDISISHFLIIYLIICVLTQIIYKISYGNKKILFFILVFIFSYLFPIGASLLSLKNHSYAFVLSHMFIYMAHSTTTLFCGVLMYPFLQKYFQKMRDLK